MIHSFLKDIEMIFATVLGFKVKFADEKDMGIERFEFKKHVFFSLFATLIKLNSLFDVRFRLS